jgi:hypothetical protein
VIAAGEFGKRGTLRPPPPCLGLLRVSEFRGSAHALPALLRPAASLGGAGADKVALQVRQAAQHGNHQPPGAGAAPTTKTIGLHPLTGRPSERFEKPFAAVMLMRRLVLRSLMQQQQNCHNHMVSVSRGHPAAGVEMTNRGER